MLGSLVSILIGLGSLVCAIIVLIKLFQTKGILHGILGLLCGLYTFIWGWMNADRLGIRPIMILWSILIILGFVFGAWSRPGWGV